MVSSVLVDALSDPTRALLELYDANQDIDTFPARVAAHFGDIFASKDAFSEIPSLHIIDPTHNDRCLVSFRAMIQDTSPSPEMYLAKRSGGRCGGWGMADDGLEDGLNYSDLRENAVVWAVSVPAESSWVAAELGPGSHVSGLRPPVPESHPHKFPCAGQPHLGVQVKVYDRVDSLQSTDVVTMVGILTMEPMTAELESPNAVPVPTLHVLFSRPLPLTIAPRVFPYYPVVSTFPALRDELVSWIADEGLAGDKDAAEWVLLSIIAKVQSRTPALLPPSLTISRFPPPSAQSLAPSLSTVLSHLLPIVVTLPLSLDVLNNSSFAPESKNEDLHSGRLQIPRGSVCVVTEGGVTEGGVFDRGIMNLRALQEMMTGQTLEYIFPFSRFAFKTDVAFLILSEGKKSTFFQTNINVPLQPNIGELYKAAEKVKMPPAETLALFRDLVGGAKIGSVTIGETVAEYIQEDFVAERKAAPTPAEAVTSDDLIHRMMIARLFTLSMHQSEVSIDIWERVKTLEAARKTRLTAVGGTTK
ncbi:putative alanine racemase-domain-containing protein [Mycena rosella]|uniref:Alanine racemase-domain-containing protein n=1 Tax=Mycena rosella TaxID=1033263 RepID=A0AAD7DZF2_MYCRO|nr:putative alanine racemase-domain-containing protein [Mycena rosella]